MSTRLRRLSVVVLALLLSACAADAARVAPEQEFTSRVLQVEDGDTLQIAAGRGVMRVRIFGIDAPESDQPFGREARELAARLLSNQTVIVRMRDVDSYGRLVADLSVGGRHIGRELILAGAAWHYAAYSNERELALAEQEARKARRGLWAAANPVAPWDFRASARSASSPPASPNTNPGAVRFHGNRASRIFHAPGCEHYSCANCTVIFTSVEAAREAGFRPHEACVSGR